MGDGVGPPSASGRFSRLVTPHLKEDGAPGPLGTGPQGVQRAKLQVRGDVPPWEAVKIISSLGRETKWQDALALFWPLHRKMAYNTRVWNAVISACASGGRQSWEAALGVLERLEADPYCDADVFSYNAVLAALMSTWHLDSAVRLLHDLPSRQIDPDTCSFNTVMGTLAKQPKYCNIVLSMLEECGKGPGQDAQSFNIAIAACSRANQWEKAIDLLEVMQSTRHQPDAYSYTSAISSCRAASQAAELLRTMKRSRLQASIVTYGAVISAGASDGDWKGALALLDEARSQQLEITTIAFNAIIDSCEKGAQWDLALHLLQEMSDERIARSTSSYNSALRACGACRRWQRSAGLLDAMAADSCKPDIVSFNGVISACVRGQAWEQALEVRNSIDSLGLELDEATWTCLLTACAVGQQWRTAWGFYAECFNRTGREPSIIISNALLGALERAGRWSEALYLLQRLKGRGANEVSYSATIGACGRSSRWEWSVWLLAELRSQGLGVQDPDAGRRWAIPYSATVQACRPSRRWQEALLVVGAMRSTGGADRRSVNVEGSSFSYF
eukprot:s1114_g16.t1